MFQVARSQSHLALAATTLALLCLSAEVAHAQNKKGGQTWTDPAKATAEDPDFSVQGEYASSGGKVTQAMGLQVVALGDGSFQGVVYKGGLPGDGWDGKEKKSVVGKRQDGKVTLKPTDKNAPPSAMIVIENGEAKVIDGPKVASTLKKIERKSSTLGMKPPKGATALWDGKKESLKHWKKGAKTEETKEGLLLQQGLTSVPTFGDCTVHVEFRLPYKPKARGQGRGNSGLYLQARYETQMLDSFGLKGEHNECGGIYSVRKPDYNACYPPLSWQTYDIDFTAAKFDKDGKKTANARMTVRLNGHVIHDNVEVPKRTTASPMKEGPEPGPIYLQNHGNPVRFRNIWVKAKGE